MQSAIALATALLASSGVLYAWIGNLSLILSSFGASTISAEEMDTLIVTKEKVQQQVNKRRGMNRI